MEPQNLEFPFETGGKKSEVDVPSCEIRLTTSVCPCFDDHLPDFLITFAQTQLKVLYGNISSMIISFFEPRLDDAFADSLTH